MLTANSRNTELIHHVFSTLSLFSIDYVSNIETDDIIHIIQQLRVPVPVYSLMCSRVFSVIYLVHMI